MSATKADPIWKVDAKAVLKGGEVAGQYLDSIGKTDLASLTPDEWLAFCTKLVGGAFLAAVGDIHDGQIPF